MDERQGLIRAALALGLLVALGCGDDDAQPATPPGGDTAGAFDATLPADEGVVIDSERPHTATWTQQDGYVELVVDFPATDETTTQTDTPPIMKLVVPLGQDAIAYRPALTTGAIRTFPLSGYAFVGKEQRMALALSDGLLGLGPGLAMVLDLSTVHLGATVAPGTVTLEDRVYPAHEDATWKIRFYTGGAAAAAAGADALNVFPPSVFQVPAP